MAGIRPVTPGPTRVDTARLPSASTAGSPRLDARYIDNGRNKMAEIEVVNHGPGDVYELDVSAAEKEGLVTHGWGDFPVPRLPAGKSVRVMRAQFLGSGGSYFTIAVTGKTVDGTPINDDIFVSGT